MLEKAYSYGLTPQEAKELTLAEMASFISANEKRERHLLEMIAKIGYAAGLVGSSTLATRKPRFEDLFQFPKDDEQPLTDVETSKRQMLVWAETINRQARRQSKGGKNGTRSRS